MNKGYWIVRADVTDPQRFNSYAAKTPAAVERFGGKFLARAGASKLVEGDTRSRNTIIEFPSYQCAIDCWNSKEYQDAKMLRIGGAELDVVIVEGCAE
jgi:uncharacterized protein (DUF1330 family)